jgi:hypothetical protein
MGIDTAAYFGRDLERAESRRVVVNLCRQHQSRRHGWMR